MSLNGHIQLHRSILEWEWYDDINTCRLFLHLILKANWKEEQWQGLTIKRGQRLTSIQALAAETKLTPKQVRGALEKLKRTNEVASESTNKYTIITINNYDKYQAEGKQEDKQAANEGQAEGKQRATNEESNKAISKDSSCSSVCAEDISALMSYCQENGFGAAIRAGYTEMQQWLVDGFPAMLIKRAIKEAALNGKPTWAYVGGILSNWKDKNIWTVEAAEAEKLKHEQEKARRQHCKANTAGASRVLRDDI